MKKGNEIGAKAEKMLHATGLVEIRTTKLWPSAFLNLAAIMAAIFGEPSSNSWSQGRENAVCIKIVEIWTTTFWSEAILNIPAMLAAILERKVDKNHLRMERLLYPENRTKSVTARRRGRTVQHINTDVGRVPIMS